MEHKARRNARQKCGTFLAFPHRFLVYSELSLTSSRIVHHLETRSCEYPSRLSVSDFILASHEDAPLHRHIPYHYLSHPSIPPRILRAFNGLLLTWTCSSGMFFGNTVQDEKRKQAGEENPVARCFSCRQNGAVSLYFFSLSSRILRAFANLK